MRLTIKDRLVLPDILPEQGGMLDMILVRSIIGKIVLTAKEITDFEVEQEGNSLKWNMEKDTGVEICFEPSELELLKARYHRLDEEKSVTSRIFDLCLKLKEL